MNTVHLRSGDHQKLSAYADTFDIEKQNRNLTPAGTFLCILWRYKRMCYRFHSIESNATRESTAGLHRMHPVQSRMAGATTPVMTPVLPPLLYSAPAHPWSKWSPTDWSRVEWSLVSGQATVVSSVAHAAALESRAPPPPFYYSHANEFLNTQCETNDIPLFRSRGESPWRRKQKSNNFLVNPSEMTID